MTAVVVDIAEKVKDALNGHTFTPTFTAARGYAEWDQPLEDDDTTLHVDVVPLQPGPDLELEERGAVDYTVQIDVGVRKRVGTASRNDTTGRIEASVLDGLVALVEQIAEFFLTDRLTDTNTAVWQGTEIKLLWSKKHVRTMGQFFGFVRLTFSATKAL